MSRVIGRTGRAGREGYAATIVTPKEMKAIKAIETLCKAKIDWIGGEPSTENLTSADFSATRERTRRERGKANREDRKETAPRSPGVVRPFRNNAVRQDSRSVSRRHREFLPPASAAPVIGLGDHVPEFLKRPVRAAG